MSRKRSFTLQLFIFFAFAITGAAQQFKQYDKLTQNADAFFLDSRYRNAVNLYAEAIEKNGGMGKVVHRYKAASCYAVLKIADSAFYHLDKIAFKGGFTELDLLTNDDNFRSLHHDSRWLPIVTQVKKNRENKDLLRR